MEDADELVYNTNLCGICQDEDHSNLITTSMLSEYLSEHGNSYLDVLKFIFPDIEWIIDGNIIPLLCKICLETIKEIEDFKKICLDMNQRRAFDAFPDHSTINEQIKIDILSKNYQHSANVPMEVMYNGETDVLEDNNLEPTGKNSLTEVFDDNLEETICNNEDDNIIMESEAQLLIKEAESTMKESSNINAFPEFSEIVEEETIAYSEDIEVQNHSQVDITKNNVAPKLRKEGTQIRSIYQAKYFPNRNDRMCKECYAEFPSYEELREHVNTSHVILRKYRCEICNVGFIGRDAFYRHDYKHNGTRNYPCPKCERKYITRGDLTLHMKYHDSEPTHKCEVCDAKFKTIANLRTHAVVHNDPKDFKYLCKMCGNKYSTSGALSDHIQHRHNTRSVACAICSKKFSQKNLKRHLATHSDDCQFHCHLCEGRFKKRNILTMHLTKQHFIGNYKYKIEKKFHCAYCQMKFNSQGKLARHMRTHTGVKPFKCRLCSMRFICKYYIKTHLRLKHDIDVEAANYDTAMYYEDLGSDDCTQENNQLTDAKIE